MIWAWPMTSGWPDGAVAAFGRPPGQDRAMADAPLMAGKTVLVTARILNVSSGAHATAAARLWRASIDLAGMTTTA